MKDFLLLIVGGAVLVALFADGGLELSPTISPAFDAQLNVQYAPDRSVTTTTIEQQTTVIYQAPNASTAPGVHLVDAGPGRCAAQPGDVIESEQGNGACYVVNAGRRYFVNPNGNRWEVDNTAASAGSDAGLMPLATPLAPPDAPTLDQLQAAFLRNGGELPAFWNWRSDDSKERWLTQREETWR